MADPQKYPTESEIDALTAAPVDKECEILCELLLDTVADLPTATGKDRLRDLALIRSLRARMKSLHCKPCLPQ
jgi:hypothetical protein